MPTYTPKRLSGPTSLTTSPVSSYTVGAGKTAVLKQILFNNTSTSNVIVQAYVVPVGGSAAGPTAIVSDLSIGPKSQVIWSADIPLDAGEQIYLSAGTGAVVTCISSGIEIV